MVSPETKNELNALIRRYLKGMASPQEKLFVEAYYDFLEQGNELPAELSESDALDAIKQRMRAHVEQETEMAMPEQTGKLKPLKRWLPAVAAVLALLLTGAAVLYYNQLRQTPANPIVRVPVKQANDVPAGMDGAILTLSDGKTMVVDTMHNGIHSMEQAGNITKAGGTLVFKPNAAGEPAADQYNTLTTPRARQCSLELPDGTRVWVNAASSLKFPVAFNGPRREVEITGEAYFEIAKDAAKPFIVKVNDSYIQVLGTSFNVMAYGNENKIQTTLLEGAVVFKHQNNAVPLKPGEQCTLQENGRIKTVENADVDFITAWKNGRTVFKNADVKTIMRQVERWYDLEVVFEGTVTKETFSGNISRKANLSQVLKMLELSNIHFELDQQHKKLIVKP